jgi:hypothetical protein
MLLAKIFHNLGSGDRLFLCGVLLIYLPNVLFDSPRCAQRSSTVVGEQNVEKTKKAQGGTWTKSQAATPQA